MHSLILGMRYLPAQSHQILRVGEHELRVFRPVRLHMMRMNVAKSASLERGEDFRLRSAIQFAHRKQAEEGKDKDKLNEHRIRDSQPQKCTHRQIRHSAMPFTVAHRMSMWMSVSISIDGTVPAG